MPNYRRSVVPGGTYFFTVVTHQRRKNLCNDDMRDALHSAIRSTQAKWPFLIDAWVLLPDHLHAIWTLPRNDRDYSARWSMIKRLVTQQVGFTSSYGAHGAPYNGDSGGHGAADISASRLLPTVGCAVRTNSPPNKAKCNQPCQSESRKKRREGHLWQRRFWEHLVRDEGDLNRCRDYLHWNPVKHGQVSRVADWPYSTFHRFVRKGWYPVDWGGDELINQDERMFRE